MKTLEEMDISPAPWECVRNRAGGIDIIDGENNLIAEVLSDDAHYRGDGDMAAAAPDLYAALRNCVEKMCEYCRKEARHSLPGRTCENGCAVMLAAKAALEKAGGAE